MVERLPELVEHIASALIAWGTANPKTVLVLLAVFAALMLANNARGPAGNWRDPKRIFSAEERRAIHARAGARCEHKSMVWMRCRRPGTQADHVFPWSKGGPTTMQNGASLCAEHNRAKSNHTPSRLYVWRLERRRRRYFPVGAETRVMVTATR